MLLADEIRAEVRKIILEADKKNIAVYAFALREKLHEEHGWRLPAAGFWLSLLEDLDFTVTRYDKSRVWVVSL